MQDQVAYLEDGVVHILVDSEQGALEILVDVADFPLVQPYRWHVACNAVGMCYASTSVNGTSLYMHRLLMQPAPTQRVDHVEPTQTLDNRRSNLRCLSIQGNALNRRGANKGNPSGVRGVTHYRSVSGMEYWAARLQIGDTLRKKYFPYTDEGLAEAQAHLRVLYQAQISAGEARAQGVVKPRGFAKLSDAQVAEIKRRRRAGEPLKSLALAFGIDASRISKIMAGKLFPHVS